MSNQDPAKRLNVNELLSKKAFDSFNASFQSSNVLNGRYVLLQGSNISCDSFQVKDKYDAYKL
jgi:hypothetical protein